MTLFEVTRLENAIVGPVDLRLEVHDCLALRGPSGTGKTLLLRALADLDPHGGELRLQGRLSTDFKPGQWRTHVGFLPAESQWWAERVGDHFPVVDEGLLERLGFGPEVMEWSVARLSTGERQRLALARLLANEPAVLLLDEPTAALDPENAGRVESLIADYRTGREAAVIWVSHDPAQQRRVATRLARIENGKLQWEGM